ncbi:glycosyltransferase, partial [Patescibacteria group bacterium]
VLLANSQYIQKRIKRIYARSVVRIKLGVTDSEVIKSKRENFYLTVGPLTVFKGMDFLVKAIAHLPKEKRHPLIVVANAGRDKTYIQNLAKKLNVELKIVSNIYKGIDDKKLIDLYKKAKLFLFAPFNEPFGLVVLEAMSYGLPVVGVNEGGLKEMIENNKNGWLVNRDPKAFSKTIVKALGLIDNNFRIATRNTTKKWQWNKSALEMEKLLEKISRTNEKQN